MAKQTIADQTALKSENAGDISESPTNDSHVELSKKLVCGIIMPIADTDGYPVGHWRNVHDIICEASLSAGFNANLVSSDDDVAVIQKRIVQNIYDNPIVVCDISAKNANVMFELGMRLAFDKPTVIIKDERTPYSFDISSIEHLEYPSDLRYQSINSFKEKLAGKIKETYQKAISDPSYTTFLKHFGTFKVAQLDQKEVSETEYLASEIKELKHMVISALSNSSKKPYSSLKPNFSNIITNSNHDIKIVKDGLTSYIIESDASLMSRTINEKLQELLEASGLHIESFYNKSNRIYIQFKLPLTNNDEMIFKMAVESILS